MIEIPKRIRRIAHRRGFATHYIAQRMSRDGKRIEYLHATKGWRSFRA